MEIMIDCASIRGRTLRLPPEYHSRMLVTSIITLQVYMALWFLQASTFSGMLQKLFGRVERPPGLGLQARKQTC